MMASSPAADALRPKAAEAGARHAIFAPARRDEPLTHQPT